MKPVQKSVFKVVRKHEGKLVSANNGTGFPVTNYFVGRTTRPKKKAPQGLFSFESLECAREFVKLMTFNNERKYVIHNAIAIDPMDGFSYRTTHGDYYHFVKDQCPKSTVFSKKIKLLKRIKQTYEK